MAKVLSPNTRTIPTFDDMSDDDDSAASCSESCDDESSNGSVDPKDITVMGADDDDGIDKNNNGQAKSKAVASIHFWLNLILLTVLTSGTTLSVLAYHFLSRVDDLSDETFEQLPAIVTGAIAATFGTILLQAIVISFKVRKSLASAHMYQETITKSFLAANIIPKSQSHGDFPRSMTDKTAYAATDSNSSENSQIRRLNSTTMGMMNHHQQQHHAFNSAQPIPELFTDTTVLFADIEGFTAWSSVREPSQVFTLLETMYHSFDNLALKYNIFKVETVGDCYVAVSGLPDRRKDHAVAMAKFANACLKRMRPLCKRLEIQLGPDTGDLNIRIGLHSGPVTGGVLRGAARFQLFGDTVNTAARIESTGQGGQIHVSEATAKLLRQAGKSKWLSMRPQRVTAKGKGSLQTYWLNVRTSGDSAVSSNTGGGSSGSGDDSEWDSASEDFHHRQSSSFAVISSQKEPGRLTKVGSSKITSSKMERLIAWNVDILHRLLKQIVARRQCLVDVDLNRKADADESIYMNRRGTFVEEVKETIALPSFNYSNTAAEQAEHLNLDSVVYEQLKDFVRSVANMYADNPFHNFEHASHVAMSTTKLLSRIVAPSARDFDASMAESKMCLHDHTYGITSDPLTQFACVLSALIHDADHPGVPNSQLVKEQTIEAQLYQNKSVAESNSVDRCWNLLMESKYADLRKTIYTTSAGLARFRSLVVNSVMATDICDRDLKTLRDARWEKAFNRNKEDPKRTNDRKATIVIEHLIQASDVSHCMQHYTIYRKWNERFFQECYRAYRAGRATEDPCINWYEGEKAFYDYYIIPLAKKLKECGVFGVSSSEYLDYAVRNRQEWEEHGKDTVEEMVRRVKELDDDQQ